MQWDTETTRYSGPRNARVAGIVSANAGRESGRRTAAEVPYVATVSFPDGDPVQIRFTADANLDDAALYAAAQAAAEEEYYGPLTVGNIDEYDPTPLARRRTAGWNESNWRNYGDSADYEDALYPEANPRARVEEPYSAGEFLAQVWDGSGDLIQEETFYDLQEGIAWATKLLQKAYKGEAKGNPGQGKFFTTPGKGKLFGHRTASTLWDSMTEPRHKVAGWDWDERLSGYVADAATDFACVCGSNVEAPGYCACRCGKVWNSYQITANGSTRLICREVPQRPDAVLSNREPARR